MTIRVTVEDSNNQTSKAGGFHGYNEMFLPNLPVPKQVLEIQGSKWDVAVAC